MPATALQNALVDDAPFSDGSPAAEAAGVEAAAVDAARVTDPAAAAKGAATTEAVAAAKAVGAAKRVAAVQAAAATKAAAAVKGVAAVRPPVRGGTTPAPYLRAVEPLDDGSDRARAMAAHPSSHRRAERQGRPVLRAVMDGPTPAPVSIAPPGSGDAGSTSTQIAAQSTQPKAPATEPAPLATTSAAVDPAPVERAGRMDDPGQLCAALALCVVEIIAGARPLEQVGYWVTDAVHLQLLRHSVIAARTRAVAAEEPKRPRVRIGTPHLFEPREGVVEAVVMVHQTSRSRAMTIRLERHRSRWRATALSML